MNFRLLSLFLAATGIASAQDHKHPHDDAPGSQTATAQTGPVRLTKKMVYNLGLETAEVETVSRYQVYRQTHKGTYTLEFTSDSAADAVGVFLNQSPAFEGGELQLWDHREERVSALVEWRMEKTDFGFPVFNRTNVFHDRLLGLIARQMQVREEIRAEVQHSVRLSA